MIEIIDVNSSNVETYGFFCLRSKPKSEGYKKKIKWLKHRFNDGLKLKIIQDNGSQKDL
ncbi:hypothetical protein [Anaerobacillus alkalidiazotrophicus]|uniref:hypothetical protein n=1 Tax=Anaerobacillus alkalidiazotrophicus TaxID=472963 RepID=UPI0014723AA8|nr:hypothetical protein [Anaerobacillus alkalidiazotrophicus]